LFLFLAQLDSLTKEASIQTLHMPVKTRRHVAEATISKSHNRSDRKNLAAHMKMDPLGLSPQRKHIRHSSSDTKQYLDLKVIDIAFGRHSDLYEDVLQVATSATQEEIQLAYFDRRSELFTLLAKIDSMPQSESMVNQRYKAERKMDSVVLAVRVLGDPTLRASYDNIRHERLREPIAAQQTVEQRQHLTPRLVTPTSEVGAAGFDDGNSDIYDSSVVEDTESVEVEIESLPQVRASTNRFPRRESRKKKRLTKVETEQMLSTKPSKIRKKKYHHNQETNDGSRFNMTHGKDTGSTNVMSDEDENVINPPLTQRRVMNLIEDNLSIAMESRQEDDTLAAETMDTMSTIEKETEEKSAGVFSCFSGSRILRRVSDEISGAFEDTLVSVDQVFNAFTLTDKDIKAVTKKIHKAKRQLDN
jgi:curved DNA-binding protein CbpA